MTSQSSDSAREILQRIIANVETVILGQKSAIEKSLLAMLSGGHVLLEDYPGTGKTTLSKALALSIEAKYKRIQFTPDLLPSDIIGVSIYDQPSQKFLFHEGPIFANIVLADEINRASPRTQAALLEAMAEGQVSVDGTQSRLEDIFFVIATQNPVEFRGTYPLPEAQMDRFALRFSLGYVSPEEEMKILTGQMDTTPIDNIKSCATLDDLLAIKSEVSNTRVSDEIKKYIVDIVSATRNAQNVQLGASPRASLTLMKASQALAFISGDEFVTPDHILELAVPAIAHRLVLDSSARFSGITSRQVVEDILEKTPVPN